MPTIAERLETATALLESQVPLLTAGVAICTTKASEASIGAANASESANNASASASAAAISAATAAAIAAGLNFKGTQAGVSVPATSTLSGDCYLIISAGTSQSKTWALLDLAVYNGTSGSWSQVANAVWAGLSLPMVIGRSTALVLLSDGATSSRGAWWTLGAPGALGGMPLELVAEFDVPTSAFTVGAAMAAFADATGLSDVANCLALKLGAGDSLFIRQYGATTADYRLFYYGGFRAAYAGQKNVRIRASFPAPNSATSPTVFINEVDCSASFTLSTGGAPPNWVPTTFQASRFVSGYFAPAGRFVPHGPILGTLTAAEGLAWLQTGRLPTWCEAGTGSAVSLIASDSSTFDSSLGNWTIDSGPATLAAVAGKMRVTNLSGGISQIRNAAWSGLLGWRYRLTFKHRLVSGTAQPIYVRPSGSYSNWSATTSFVPTVVETYLYHEFVMAGIGASGVSFQLSDPGSGEIYEFDDITLVPLGPIFKPVIQPCSVLDDAGANGLSGVLAAGIAPITADKRWRIRAPVDMSTTGAKQLLGAAVFADPHKQAIDSIEVECAGAPTFSLGDGSGGSAQYSASAAHTAGRARRTLASPFPADSAKTGIYANVTVAHASATAEKVTICGHRTD